MKKDFGRSTSSTIEPNSVIICHSHVKGLSEEDFSKFIQMGKKVSLAKGTTVFLENDKADCLYVILEGEAQVYKESYDKIKIRKAKHVLATLTKGDTIGDMALIENKPRSASLRAKTKLTMLRFEIDTIKKHPNIDLILTQNLAQKLSERLRHTNEVTVKNMRSSLDNARARNALGLFMIALFWLISIYTVSLTQIISFKNRLTTTTPLSVLIIIVILTMLVMAMRKTGLPLSSFGITWDGWARKSAVAIVYSIPFMLLIVLVKASILYLTGNPNHLPLFSSTYEHTLNGQPSLPLYFGMMGLYILFSPVQELVARSAMQSTFFLFLPGKEMYRTWNAIILSNLLFATAHSHLGAKFAAIVFFPGLFWGWIFHKQRSLVSVSASHIVLGLWAVFIVGMQHL